MKKFALLLMAVIGLSAHTAKSQVFEFEFTEGREGWISDFADYPTGDSLFFDLQSRWAPLPRPLDSTRHSILLSGNNHSDDLFMFVTRKISGLTPNKLYRVLIEVELASDVPTNAMGIGGAPGESVFLKAGASLIQPRKTEDDGWYRMNTDKGNQANPGADMDTIGHIGVTDTTTVYTLIRRSNEGHPFQFTTDQTGEAWVTIGTDSGFEGTTTIYISRVRLVFDNMTGMEDPPIDSDVPLIEQRGDLLRVNGLNKRISLMELFRTDGSLAARVSDRSDLYIGRLETGVYILRITTEDGSIRSLKFLSR